MGRMFPFFVKNIGLENQLLLKIFFENFDFLEYFIFFKCANFCRLCS